MIGSRWKLSMSNWPRQVHFEAGNCTVVIQLGQFNSILSYEYNINSIWDNNLVVL